MADIKGLPANSYTYISLNASAATSWLDHILSSNPSLVYNISFLYGHSAFDHIPLCCVLELPDYLNLTNFTPFCNEDVANILWEKASESQLENYTGNLEFIALRLWSPVLSCSNVFWSSEFIRTENDFLYCSLITRCWILLLFCLKKQKTET